MTEDASTERRLRRFAKDSGFNFKRSTMGKGPENRGGYQLFEKATNRIIAGRCYELSLRDVTIELQKLRVLGTGE